MPESNPLSAITPMSASFALPEIPRYRAYLCLMLACCLPSGCTWFNGDADLQARLEKETTVESPPAEVTDSQQVRWDGGGVIIGETDALAFTPEAYLNAVNRLLEADRIASVQGMVENYPDIAIQTLQEVDSSAASQHNQQVLPMIASLLDTRCSVGDVWQTYVQDLQSLPRRSEEELDIRMRFWRYLKNDQPEKALNLKITRTLQREQGVMLRAEFHRLEAIAGMMAGKHESSIENLEQALDLIKTPSPWFASKLQLLLGEFYRHAERWDDWKSTWESAVIKNSKLSPNLQSIDPQFWNRAAYLRPAGMPWPQPVIENLRTLLAGEELIGDDQGLQLASEESVIWFVIGFRHLQRGEGQNALLAFKKAEASESKPLATRVLQLYQARSLLISGQPGAASAILFRMASEREGTILADRAKAILASMKLQNGSLIQGINLVESAMDSLGTWPRDEQLQTQADYGLALLMQGQETRGLRQLEQAGEQFALAGDMAQARQCLWNRAKYFELTEQKDQYRSATRELTKLESRLY